MKFATIMLLALSTLLCSFAKCQTLTTVASLKKSRISEKTIEKKDPIVSRLEVILDFLGTEQISDTQKDKTSHFGFPNNQHTLRKKRTFSHEKDKDENSITFIGAMIPFITLPSIESSDNDSNDILTGDGFSLFIFLKKKF